MTIAEILSKAGENETDALREHATLICLSKISRYKAECGCFRSKYGESLESLRNRIHKTDREEDFPIEEDIMDWEYADAALKWWQSRIEELRNAG
ncbi:MAG: hypothetical protein K9N48_05210 [Verrucomicrobia bacterium]|nr:hypothetical protein [Verrucomicrobiota bacterium]MCF7708653.1 hypothetical protein [Verrucomicrobiota bacterium]